MRRSAIGCLVAGLVITAMACAPAPPANDQTGQPAQQAPAASGPKTITMVVRYEVTDLAAKRLAGAPADTTKRAFNAMLALSDGQGTLRPYLAESLPQLNTDSWK